MDLFSHQYESLIDYARSVIYNRKLLIEPGDLVNDAYLKFIESGKSFDTKEFKIYISGFGFKESDEQRHKHHIGTPKKQYLPKDQICCNRCHEVKPANAYELARLKGEVIIRKICRDCTNKRRRERYRANPTKSIYKPKVIPLALRKPPGRPKKYKYSSDLSVQEKKNICFKEWVKRNREKWNSYNSKRQKSTGSTKKWQKQQKEKLTDKYLIALLKQQKKDFSPESIEQKRQIILERRKKQTSILLVS